MIQILKFFAPWCQPCRSYNRVFNKVTSDLGINPTIIDIDKEPQLKTDWGVSAIPTTIVLKDGKEVGRKTGALRDKELRELIAVNG